MVWMAILYIFVVLMTLPGSWTICGKSAFHYRSQAELAHHIIYTKHLYTIYTMLKDFGPTLYTCYIHVVCLLGARVFMTQILVIESPHSGLYKFVLHFFRIIVSEYKQRTVYKCYNVAGNAPDNWTLVWLIIFPLMHCLTKHLFLVLNWFDNITIRYKSAVSKNKSLYWQNNRHAEEMTNYRFPFSNPRC